MKSTRAEMEARVMVVYRMLIGGASRERILQHAASAWGMSARQADEYAARARQRLEDAAATNYRLELGMALARLDEMYAAASDRGDIRAMLDVQRERSKTLGLYAPARQEITGAAGGALALALHHRELPPLPEDTLNDILEDN